MRYSFFDDDWYVRHVEETGLGTPVTIPHDAMLSEPRTAIAEGGLNVSWFEGRDYVYTKTFTVSEAELSQYHVLEFEGVYRKAEVFINGKKAAFRPYGYTNFYVELDSFLRAGENTIEVIARNADQPNSRWYSGAGIYRPVKLWTSPKAHIELNGVRIRTVSIDPAVVEVRVSTSVPGTVKVQILDGETGKVRKAVKTPFSDEEDSTVIGVPFNTYAFERINPDGIRICNFRGKEKPADILIKDRYCRVYALDENLNLLWKFQSDKNTGHCPLPVDINGDGRDEVLVGYNMLSADGKKLWTYPITADHTDEIVAGKFRGDGKGYFACVSGTQGFFIGDFSGNIVARDLIGHAQRVSVANYCKAREGFEIAVTNCWGHQGVIYLYDSDGNEIWEMENEMNGNLVTSVNWDGNGVEMILTNADSKKGGLLTGEGIRGVEFPEDGHPTLCCEAIDLYGDEREELVCWDYKSMYIYTQEDNPQPQVYHPVKFPSYNASNYRGEYAYPDESYLRFN